MRASHFFEESDELRLHLRGGSFPALVAEAGRALAQLAGPEPPTQERTEWRELEVSAPDRAALLVEWLNELIFRTESEGWVATDFSMVECSPTRLRIRVRGVGRPSRSHPVKAATLERARVVDSDDGVRAEVTLDV